MATSLLVALNRAYSELDGAISSGAVSLTVKAGEGANFPSTYPFNITIDDEIFKCTNRVTDVLTVVSAQESTSAANHADGVQVSLNITAKAITDLNTIANRLETDVPTYVATGDMRYASAAATGAILTVGATDTILSVQGGVPTWQASITVVTLTLTELIMVGDVSGTIKSIKRADTDEGIAISGGDNFSGGGAVLFLYGKTFSAEPGALHLYTPGSGGSVGVSRLTITGMVTTAVATWSAITHTGLVLSGALDANGQAITNHAQAIADNAIVTIDHATVADNDYAKFTANGLEGRSYAEVASDIQGSVDHGSIAGLSDNDHTQYVLHTEVDDTPVDGVTIDPISSNWAFDHGAAADPHTGYRLESVDHSHQSTGAQAGKIDHGFALNGLADDDHTQYTLKSLFDAHSVLIAVSDNTPLALTVAASRIVGRKASGNISAMTGAETLALLTGANLDVGAYDVRGATLTADGLTSGRVVFAGASGVLSDDGDFTFSVDTLTITKIAGTEFTGAVTGISLSEIENLENDKTFTMTSKNLTYNFTTPSQGITLNVTGAFSDHLFHIHQTTGNPGVGSELIHLQTEDSDVIPLHIEHSGDNASFEALEFELHRSSPTDGDNIVFGWHFWHDGAATSTAQIELAKITVTATDVSENTEDASFTFSVMKDGSMTDLVTITSTVITLAGTLAGVTALDATTESTIEAAIDTLANLTSIQGQTFTLAGAFITSGAYSLTLTLGANTNVTLPTTGTLATLAGTEELDNKTLDSSVLKGTFTNDGTVVLPAFSIAGNLTLTSGYNIVQISNILGHSTGNLTIENRRVDGALYLKSSRTAANAGNALYFVTLSGGDAARNRLIITGGVTTAVATWENITHTGFKLSGDLDFNAKNLVTDTSTGTKIGTATNQKIGFFGDTPVVQLAKASYNNWTNFSDIVNALVAIGLFDVA